MSTFLLALSVLILALAIIGDSVVRIRRSRTRARTLAGHLRQVQEMALPAREVDPTRISLTEEGPPRQIAMGHVRVTIEEVSPHEAMMQRIIPFTRIRRAPEAEASSPAPNTPEEEPA